MDNESSYDNQEGEETTGEAASTYANVDEELADVDLEKKIDDTETSYEEQVNYDDMDVSTDTDTSVVK